MRILIVAPQPFYQERGTPMAVRLVAETLCSQGHDVDLLAFHDGQDITIPGLKIFRARRPWGVHHVPIGISMAKLLCDVALCMELIRLLKKTRYDVVHAVEEAVFPAALLKSLYGYKLVYDMDSSLVDQLGDKWRFIRPLRPVLVAIERWAVRRADAVLAVCEALAQKVRPWIGPERVTVLPDVPMGAAPETVEVTGTFARMKSGGLVTALYVGNLETYQGIDLMLEGFATCGVAGLTLIIIGGIVAHIARYQERARTLGIANRVEFLGPRPVEKLQAYLTQADILISPRTLGGNTPMKVYSYMQAGKAILATDIPSHTQVLDPQCALLVPPSPRLFADALAELAGDPGLRARLGQAARDKVKREFSLPVFQQKLKSAYEHLNVVEHVQPAVPLEQSAIHGGSDPQLWPTQLLEYTHDAIIIWEMVGRGILYWNRAAEQLYGYSRSEAFGRTTHALLNTQLKGSITELESNLARFGVWVGELRHTTRDGSQVRVEARLAMLAQHDGRWLVLEVNRNITDQRIAEGAREAMERQLMSLQQLRRTFT